MAAAPDAGEDLPPGYHEALAALAEARDLAFVDVPQKLCGTPVLPLDLRNLVILTYAGNPFIVGGRAGLHDVRQLLWLQTPEYLEACASARTRFLDRLPSKPEPEAVAEVRRWIDDTFQDAPPGRGSVAAGKVVIEEPISSFVASHVDLLSSEYGWDCDRIVGTAARRGIPLTQIYQFEHCIKRRLNPKSPITSGRIAKVLGDWLRASIAKDDAGDTA